jgi:alanyl-tRNA synthetase
MMTSAEIRQSFLDYFQEKGHQIVPSAPIVVKNDPTLMFTNAGMNQFKDYFLGNRRPPQPRVADTQKCLRVSGKHNDLEEVGWDSYHHTMFEMLGNWSFGDYFKAEAIAWAWNLLTEVYRIPKEQLYVTVFGGDEKDNLPVDEEAYHCWEKHIDPSRILYGNKKDNFWEMGDTGPCGPCSEIHIDCRNPQKRQAQDGGTLVNTGDPEVIEIWNLVFMEFNRQQDSSLVALPARHVDTGMGFERLVRILQGKHSNYDTDLFVPLITETEHLTGHKYQGGETTSDVAFRVIADHIRAISFAVADGQLPSNTGAGYVIRRILRRAVRYYFSFLGVREPLLYRLVDGLAAQFAEVFPGLMSQREFVGKVIREEEAAFLKTLESGIKRLEEYVSREKKGKKEVDGKTAFELYDTFGFPLDLTRLLARESGYTVDEEGFQQEMARQKSRSRAATSQQFGDWTILVDAPTTFIGYDHLTADTRVTRYRKVTSKGKSFYQLMLEQTPFYAESGGQVGDSGELVFTHDTILVTDTRRENDLILHQVDRIPASVEGQVLARVDRDKRLQTAGNHTATHLLHAALRQILGKHVQQKGSLVTSEYLRFDFSHFSKMTAQELTEVEKMVNRKIRENIPVEIRQMPKKEALALGAMALFGEKYGSEVRVVITDPAYSVELCGGTHLQATGQLGLFKIISEGAVAAGVRRIEARTGEGAEDFVRHNLDTLEDIRERFKYPKDLLKSVDGLWTEKAALEKKLQDLGQQQLNQLASALAADALHIGPLAFVGKIVAVDNADGLKQLCFRLKPRFDRYVFALAAAIGGKAAVALMLDEETAQTKGLDASRLIREKIAPLIRGGGGGQATFATAGGSQSKDLHAVIELVKSLVL